MRYRVDRHLDRLQLKVFSYGATNLFTDLVDRLKSSSWCRHTRPPHIGNRVMEVFHCPDGTRITLTFHREVYFDIKLSDPTPYVQRRFLSALRSSSRRRDVSSFLTEAEFALDFHPDRPSDLDPLFSLLSSSAVLRYSRTGSYSYYTNEKDFTVTHYQGRGGNVRSGKRVRRVGLPLPVTIDEGGNLISSEAKQTTCSKGLRVYKTKDGAARIELQLNKLSLRSQQPPLSINSLPLKSDQVNVLDYVEFRHTLDADALNRLLKVVNKKQIEWTSKRSGTPFLYSDEAHLKRHFLKAMGRAAVSKRSEPPLPLLCKFEELPAALQISVFKGLKKEYDFTNQADEFFPVDERLTREIKRKMKNKKVGELNNAPH